MIALATVITSFEADLLANYGKQLLPSHRQALHAMKHCRTMHSPRMRVQCVDCGEQRLVPHSCGHRACPHCQQHESEQWLERQLKRQVPGEYFLVTFTLPAQLRTLAWAHQRSVYDALLKCSWQTLRSFSENDRQLRGTPGAIAVLHSHSRRPNLHHSPASVASRFKGMAWAGFVTEERAGVVSLRRALRPSETRSGRAIGPAQ